MHAPSCVYVPFLVSASICEVADSAAQASICEVADSACGLTLFDCQIHADAETCNLRVGLAIAVGLVSC